MTRSTHAIETSNLTAEITALHDFFSGWFQGALPNDDETFADGIERRLAPEFFNVQPAGKALTREILCGAIRSAHGTNAGFKIHIRNVVLRRRFGDGLVLATYEEYQRGASNSQPLNARLSSVLMRRAADRWTWYSVHETWLPDENHAPDYFRF